MTIPELGTIRAAVPPIVVLTSNRTREIHDALKRRCLYHWIPYPDFAKEYEIITTRLPGVPARLARQVTAFVQELRQADLHKLAGVSETLDWVAALVALDQDRLDEQVVNHTLGILLKDHEDIESMRGARVAALVTRASDLADPDGTVMHLAANVVLFVRTPPVAGCVGARRRHARRGARAGTCRTPAQG